ncbi:MAG: sulfurtransferase [Rhodospirillales bacterium RIFCSPLOWO2_12_FULL_58_28]|nr:MAG: sulfurtransferase [Rhodospirillales bacterium RIFCSPLOWO2_02_FULL_58_16]OHC77428.1 MAG: sulfurtransferase [Rhodospirillales bacterium RIFCSPLOWO2_12_FULL_58_28]
MIFNKKYAGDVTPKQAWQMLGEDASAVLLDVRTQAEWTFVGAPDLSSLGKQPVFVQWQTFPEMRPNSEFAQQVAGCGVGEENTVLLICRSGKRSLDAARALTSLGFAKCYNIAAGFDGDRDPANHRGTLNGWKADGLPWGQG